MKKNNNNEKIYRLTKEFKLEEKLTRSINELLRHLSPNNYSINIERLRNLLDNGLLAIYLLESKEEIIGMGSLHYTETLVKRAAWIEDVVVHPKHQGKGLGTKITKHLIAEAKKKGIKHIDLTSRNSRIKAHEFYLKNDFEKRDTSVFRLKF